VAACIWGLSIYDPDRFGSCGGEIASGENPVVTTCQPVGAVDLLPLYALAVLLLLPDMAEVSLFGVASLRQRIAREEERSQEITGELSALRLFVQTSVRQSQTLHFVFPSARYVEDIEAKRAEYFADSLDEPSE
jgi:hypothetical protein